MVFSQPSQIVSEPDSAPLSPEQVQIANLKSAELDRSLGFSHEKDPTDEEDIEEHHEDQLSDWDDEAIARKNALVNMDIQICDSEEENNSSEVGEVDKNSEIPELPQTLETSIHTDPNPHDIPPVPVHTIQINAAAGDVFPHSGLGVVIPPDVAALLATGGYNLVMEPIPSTPAGGPSRFAVKAVPIPTIPMSTQPECTTDEGENSVQSESEVDAPRTKQRLKGLGSAHKGGKVRKYSLWTRMSFAGDVRLRGMTVKEAKVKYNNPDRKRVAEWLKEYDNGLYSNLPSMYTQEELKNMYRLKGAGRKVKDEVLEQRLVEYYNTLREELYPITTELLAYECLAHNEDFLGGASSPNFTARVSDFLRHWRKRNIKTLRKPTSTGQKLPEGYTGKWEACSYYFYLETKGIPVKQVWHGDETKIPVEEPPSKVYADKGAKRVPIRTSGQDKENLTAFLVQNAEGEKLPLYPILRGDTTANRPGAHTKKNNSSIRQRFQEVINRKSATRKSWKNLNFWVNDSAYMDEETFLHWGRTVWKYRADTSGENQPISVLLLDDLTSHKTKKVLDEFKRLYNTKIIVLPGGLTPKAQIMDTHNNRPYKSKLKAKLRAMRRTKYMAAKAEAARDPLHKGAVRVPKLTREEVVDAMLEAWEDLDPSLGANAWAAVKLMPYEMAQEKKWTPKEAFKDIRHLDFPWQMVSNIKPKDVGSDIEDFEWDNVPETHYEGTATPSAVRAQVHVAISEDQETVSAEVTESSQGCAESTPGPDSDFTQTPHVVQRAQKKSRTSPASRKPAPIFKHLLPPQIPCAKEGCSTPDQLTSSRCLSCSIAMHGNCLLDRTLCPTCYNARMLSVKATQKQKRAAKCTGSNPPTTPAKKPKVTSGMSKQTARKTPRATQTSAVLPLATISFTPKRQPTVRDPLSRAEERMVQDALKASLADSSETLSPLKSMPDSESGLLTTYNAVLKEQGRSLLTALDVEKIPSAVHSAGYGVLDKDELSASRHTREGYLRFMHSKKQAPLIAHLLGPKNLALLDLFEREANIRECEINMNFRLYDLMSLLSYNFVTDSVITCYMHYLSSIYPNVFFVDPILYKYCEDFSKSRLVRLETNWIYQDHIVWPLNLGNNHWVVALFDSAPGSTIYFVDSMNGTDVQKEKQRIPKNLFNVISILGSSLDPPRQWNPEIEVVLVPRQARNNNDCAACVNEVARAFSRNPKGFVQGEVDLMFESISLRCTQAATLLQWLYHDVCENV